jgi:hypothetical protein
MASGFVDCLRQRSRAALLISLACRRSMLTSRSVSDATRCLPCDILIVGLQTQRAVIRSSGSGIFLIVVLLARIGG